VSTVVVPRVKLRVNGPIRMPQEENPRWVKVKKRGPTRKVLRARKRMVVCLLSWDFAAAGGVGDLG
jgi:hypothetical protein